MKFNSAAVRPQHTLHQAVGALLFQARTKAIDTQIKNSTKENSEGGLWSSLPTSLHLTTLGESLVATEWMQKRNYSVVGPFAKNDTTSSEGDLHWLCMRTTQENSKDIIPKFKQARRITRHYARFRTSNL